MKPYYYMSFTFILLFDLIVKGTFTTFTTVNTSRIIYVDTRTTGANNGTSWRDAYKSLTDGLANANSGDEIWITWGIYFPTSGNDRNQSFNLRSNIVIRGAFKGTETQLSDRFADFQHYNTILSGDIGMYNDMTDNSYHVVKGENIDNVVLDNLNIYSGYANGLSQEDKKGGGIYLYSDKPNNTSNISIGECFIDKSQAELEGGNIYISVKNSTIFKLDINGCVSGLGKASKGANISFNLDNNAQFYFKTNGLGLSSDSLLSASLGGGIYINNKSNSFFDWKAKDGTLSGNKAEKGGGVALINDSKSKSNIDFKNITFFNNEAIEGGGFYIETLNGGVNQILIDSSNIDSNLVIGKKCYGGFLSNHNNSGKSKITILNGSINRNYAFSNSLTNEAGSFGGFIYNTGKQGITNIDIKLRLETSDSNFVNSGHGGFLYNDDPNASVSIKKIKITRSHSGAEGGTIYMEGGSLYMDSCKIDDSYSKKSGGIISFKNTEGVKDLKIHNSFFYVSQSEKYSAFDIQVSGTAIVKPDFLRCGFYDNKDSITNTFSAPIGFTVNDENAKIEVGQIVNCIFKNGDGGAGAIIHTVDKGSCQIKYINCLFYKNKGKYAAIVNKAGNSCPTESKYNFKNCLFWDNISGNKDKSIENIGDNALCKTQTSFSYSLVPEANCSELGSTLCNNMVYSEDPLIFEKEYEGISLLPCSPAINRGDNTAIPISLGYDLSHNYMSYFDPISNQMGSYLYGDRSPRIWEGIVDIGSMEYINDHHEYSSVLDESDKTILADRQYQDTTGWIHYYNCAQKKLMLSFKNDNLDLGKLNDGLRISSTTTSEYGIKAQNLKGADYLNNPQCDDWFVINRNWQVISEKTLNRPMLMRFHYHEKDSADLQRATPFSAYNDVWAYKITKAAPWDKIVKNIGGTYEDRVFKLQSSANTWVYSDQAKYRSSEFVVDILNGGGSLGVKKPNGTRPTLLNKFICSQTAPFRIGDSVFGKSGNYRVILKTKNGCDSLIALNLNINPVISIGLDRPNEFDNGNETGKITVVATGGSFGRYNYKWSNGGDTNTIANLKAGIYTVTVTDMNGCTDTFSTVVKPIDFQMPNAFTPNNDGLNDYYLPIITGKAIIKTFKIYNRLGNMVYDNELLDKGWDGKYNNQDCASDVYVYKLELDYGKRQILRGSGEVYLIR
jgi:gliding motility-associated-like protein